MNDTNKARVMILKAKVLLDKSTNKGSSEAQSQLLDVIKTLSTGNKAGRLRAA
jgi:hypothetical protein